MSILLTELSPEEMKVFMQEADEHMLILDEDIIKLEKDGNNAELMQKIFRSAHTLKGSAGMVGHKRMADVTHAMETLLDKLRHRKLEVNASIIDALLFGLDALKVLKEEIITGEEGSIDLEGVVARLAQASEVSGQAYAKSTKEDNDGKLKLDIVSNEKLNRAIARGDSAVAVNVEIDRESLWKAVRSLQVLTELSKMGEIIISYPTLDEIEQENADGTLKVILCTSLTNKKITSALKSVADVTNIQINKYTPGAMESLSVIGKLPVSETPEAVLQPLAGVTLDNRGNGQVAKAENIQSVRVDVKMLDTLMNMVEELVIDRARINQVGKMLDDKYPEDELITDLGETSNHIIKVINELHQDIMKVRMVPISLVFNKFPRLVRDLAQKQGKNIEFIIKGEDTELDRTINEQIHDPLIHLLRNAVDHGIEAAGERQSSGKPAQATLRLSACQEEGQIVIRLQDDGRGIDPVKVRNSAIAKGFITQEDASKLSDTEAIDLIFMSGISTANKISDISGRGVGLDIVRTNIEKLNGSLSIETETGVGTTFIIKLPLTLAISRGLMVSANNSTYIFPLVSVVEAVRVEGHATDTVMSKEVLRFRDKVIPIVRLSKVLGSAEDVENDADCHYVIVVKTADKLAGIMVDQLLDQQEFVIKPLGKQLGDIEGIAGATILGNGSVALIIDVPTLIKITQRGYASNRVVNVSMN